MFVVKVYYKIEEACLDLIVNFHQEHSILPTSCPLDLLGWVYNLHIALYNKSYMVNPTLDIGKICLPFCQIKPYLNFA